MSCFLTRFCTALPINSLMAFHSENYHNLPSCYICTTNMKAVVQIKWILFSPSVVDCIAKTCFAVLQCFDAVGWSEVQTCIWPSWCHCHSLSLASVKSRLVLPFWYPLTRVVPDKEPLNGCVCVCVSLFSTTGHFHFTCIYSATTTQYYYCHLILSSIFTDYIVFHGDERTLQSLAGWS